jgi:CRP-like cAMP-binding protein
MSTGVLPTKNSKQTSAKCSCRMGGRLEQYALFRDLPPSILDWFDCNPCEQHFAAGEVICVEGEKGTVFYLIVEGRVEVSTKSASGPLVLATLSVGDRSAKIRCWVPIHSAQHRCRH